VDDRWTEDSRTYRKTTHTESKCSYDILDIMHMPSACPYISIRKRGKIKIKCVVKTEMTFSWW
jgi:hypothetical protein